MKVKQKKGFTLIETVVAFSIVAVVALLMYTFIGQGFTLYSAETASAEEQTELRTVLSEITHKARLTPSSSITCTSGVLTVGDYIYLYDGDSITRNGTTLASDITVFDTSITNGILDIDLVNENGKQISTSLSLLE